MFGKSAPKEPEPADDSSDTVEKASTENDSGGEIAEPDDKTDETADDKPDDKPEKKQSSWWSILTNPSNLSLLNTVFQEVTANTEQGEMPTKEQLMKSVDKNKVKMPDQEQLMKTLNDKTPNTPEKEQLMQALAAQQNANGLLQKALSLKDTAMKAMNPQERQKMMQEAYDKEIEANGQSKWARRLQSGTWQGGMGGAGVGGGVGMGIGTVVGALVGGVAALPTTAVGGLVGMGVGGITGPFVKLNQDKAKEIAAREKAKGKSDEEVMETVKSEAGEEVAPEAVEDVDRGGAGTPHTPASGTAAVGQSGHSSAKGTSEKQHSGGKTKTPPARDPNAPRKKPKKLEVRSAKKPVASS
ncbi:hypothetical protein LTR29_000096 [Friedmanniomyces endolithicus]|uniref:Glycine zipper domain-containing protein n=1 Tax=Friedmanniomyces endolithicus TaxID=329885 RepID=A0A4U0UW56_9PEZI|nr:hypothetical protein LTS09_009576 [Friedmanniomyces endolithicus]KAK0948464.1 hypothetical protein LTR29_000096 [Friedmanniomyces endolithicus]TKA39872.1 hypothetical protein B0A54_10222 [Friedmanniomyces endolithicus]